jgi:hypothetical protein
LLGKYQVNPPQSETALPDYTEKEYADEQTTTLTNFNLLPGGLGSWSIKSAKNKFLYSLTELIY